MSSLLEARETFHAIAEAWARGKKATLALLVSVRGSAYRRPGAKMMMAEDNRMHGTLSGGCLEGDLYQWAELAMADGENRIQSYDLTENDMWGLGIGCKGAVDILLTPVSPEDGFWRETFARAEGLAPFALALELPQGRRTGLDGAGHTWGDPPAPALREAMAEALKSGTRAAVRAIEGSQWVIDPLLPPDPLVVAGAGHDAIPVVARATEVGFAVTVLDPRAAFNGPSRFPQPGVEFLVAEPDAVPPDRLLHRWWVIMNHNQARDEAALRLALASRPRWIGVLGPLSRTREMLTNIGHAFQDGPIVAPVGLDLGAETPEEVAVSIVAQLMAERSGRSATPLAGRERIHGTS
ncbi:MAG: XdhC family protein [Firmicutes bacterium]|nr:XdhC family protein [Alicyclobacillaceae bacterium]MCL6497080.1 XdhC family protein [Bacillota bacterium]